MFRGILGAIDKTPLSLTLFHYATFLRCVDLFRFTKEQLYLLVQQLRLPDCMTAPNRTKWTAIEGLCIVLRRLTYHNRYIDLVGLFGRGVAEIGIIFNNTIMYIHRKWSHLLYGMDGKAPWLSAERLSTYRQRLSEVCALPNLCGFIDGTVRPICRPTRNQKAVYNGHKRTHALKYQAIMAPDGMVSHLSGPIEGRRHDAGLLQESRLIEDTQANLPAIGHGGVYAVYGDPAYPLRAEIISPYAGNGITPAQQAFNANMSSVRQAVEWGFGKIITLFAFLDFKKTSCCCNQLVFIIELEQFWPTATHASMALKFQHISVCVLHTYNNTCSHMLPDCHTKCP